MKFFQNMVAISASVALLAACSQSVQQGGPVKKQDAGALAGAIGGAFAGSNLGKGSGRTLGIAAGTLLGALVGSEIGKSLDRADMMYLQQTSQRALEYQPIGKSASWNNPDSGNHGTITPTRTFQMADNTYCREFTQTVTVAGESQQAYGTACRQPDGTWKIKQ